MPRRPDLDFGPGAYAAISLRSESRESPRWVSVAWPLESDPERGESYIKRTRKVAASKGTPPTPRSCSWRSRRDAVAAGEQAAPERLLLRASRLALNPSGAGLVQAAGGVEAAAIVGVHFVPFVGAEGEGVEPSDGFPPRFSRPLRLATAKPLQIMQRIRISIASRHHHSTMPRQIDCGGLGVCARSDIRFPGSRFDLFSSPRPSRPFVS